MKAKVKATGEFVNVIRKYDSLLGEYLYIDNGVIYRKENLEFDVPTPQDTMVTNIIDLVARCVCDNSSFNLRTIIDTVKDIDPTLSVGYIAESIDRNVQDIIDHFTK